jgi:hypothetical protein
MVVAAPWHTLFPVTFTCGKALTVTVDEAVPVHPFASVAVTLYVVEVAGATLMLVVVALVLQT